MMMASNDRRMNWLLPMLFFMLPQHYQPLQLLGICKKRKNGLKSVPSLLVSGLFWGLFSEPQ